MSYFLIVILHVDDKTYEGFVNKAFGRQFLCNSLHFPGLSFTVGRRISGSFLSLLQTVGQVTCVLRYLFKTQHVRKE